MADEIAPGERRQVVAFAAAADRRAGATAWVQTSATAMTSASGQGEPQPEAAS